MRHEGAGEHGIAKISAAADPECPDPAGSKRKMFVAAAVLTGLVLLYWHLSRSGVIPDLSDERSLRAEVERWGIWGPVLLILLMVAAIVMTPIPSGPIALVAGAAYGPALGGIYVVIGAQGGALVAFWIARCLGYESLRCWPAARKLLHRLQGGRSQTWLMLVVFISRLLPFVSFDAVSYVAGVTPLTFWRFAVATLAGVIPVSFALTYFGDRLVAAETDRIMTVVLIAGGITLIPIFIKLLLNVRRRKVSPGSRSNRSG